VLVALAACAIRELALPFLLLCATFALVGRRWHELAGWIVALAAFLGWYSLHAWNLAQVAEPNDRYMADWAKVIAYPNKAAWLGQLTVFHGLPRPAGAALAVLGLAGWLALDDRAGRIAFLYLAGIMLMIALAAMPSNTHWSFLLFPLWIAGFGLWPSLVVKAVRALRDSKHVNKIGKSSSAISVKFEKFSAPPATAAPSRPASRRPRRRGSTAG